MPIFSVFILLLSLSPITLPSGENGIGFDDLTFASGLGKVLVPGGQTGMLHLIDPATHQITSISGFSSVEHYQGGHGEGITSADEGGGYIFAIDRGLKTVNIIDPATKKIIASAPLAAGPDYVRYVKISNEVWVTEPGAQQIEVFSLSPGTASIKSSLVIKVAGGPESLVIDNLRQRAYTHLWSSTTAAIDIPAHALAAKWFNGCAGSRGIALDEERGFLFAGCEEGKAIVLDVNHNGSQISSAPAGGGVDVIGYNAKLSHLYVPGSQSATMGIFQVSDTGKLSLLRIVPTAEGSHCVTADDHGNVWVCDPQHGQLLVFKD